MEAWIDNTKLLLRHNNYMQKDLVPVLGTSSPSSVNHYLSGRREPSCGQLLAIADFLKVNLDDLVRSKRHDPLSFYGSKSQEKKESPAQSKFNSYSADVMYIADFLNENEKQLNYLVKGLVEVFKLNSKVALNFYNGTNGSHSSQGKQNQK